MADTRPTLSTILSNDLLHSIAPYLHPRDISALSLTSLRNYNQLTSAPSIHRHTDLSEPKPHGKQDDSDVLRFLRCERLLSATRTLVLDGTLVTLAQVEAALASSSAIAILSLLGCKRVDERELIGYLTDPNTPKPKGLYWFTHPAAASAPTGSSRFVRHVKSTGWAAAIAATLGSLCFDTRICRGRRHAPGGDEARIASIALRGGCAGCRAEPDRPAGLEAVLVAPAPLHSSTLRAACKAPDGKPMPDCLWCEECARQRFCESCGKWWCESCTVDKKHVVRNCFECGFQCTECAAAVSRICGSCRGGYCINHNEGADDTQCEWCHISNKRRPSATTAITATTTTTTTTTTATASSNAFLTSAASSYYAHLQQTRPGNTFVKHPAGGIGGGVGRMRGLGAQGVVAGRHFQNEAIVRRRLLNN